MKKFSDLFPGPTIKDIFNSVVFNDADIMSVQQGRIEAWEACTVEHEKRINELQNILKSEALLNTSLYRQIQEVKKENKLLDSWVKHHQSSVELKCKQLHEKEIKLKKHRDILRVMVELRECRQDEDCDHCEAVRILNE